MLEHSSMLLICLWLPCWILGLPVVPALCILGFAAVVIAALGFLGPLCGVAAYMYRWGQMGVGGRGGRRLSCMRAAWCDARERASYGRCCAHVCRCLQPFTAGRPSLL